MKIKVGAACLNQTPLDWEGNLQRIKQAIEKAIEEGVSLLCLPEMCITGYGCEDYFLSLETSSKAIQSLKSLTSEIYPITFCVGLPVIYCDALYNCVAVVSYGKLLGLVAKKHLAGDGIHYEPRWFKPWPEGVAYDIDIGFSRPKPIGDLLFDLGVSVGFEICEDAWVPNRPGANLARRGVDIILNPSASHFTLGKNSTRKSFITEGARAYNAVYVYANLLGNESGRAIYDGDCIIANGAVGGIVAEGPRFSFSDFELVTAIVDTNSNRTNKLGSASFMPLLSGVAPILTGHKLKETFEPVTKKCDWSCNDEFREFTDAEALAIWDYARKSHSRGFVISLSGGADSAACAYLVHMAFMRALLRRGGEYVEQQVGVTRIREFLTCVYQSTRNSSDTTYEAAEAVAGDVGSRFHSLDVDDIVREYTRIVSKALGKDLTWENADIPLQNIQARVRAPSAWMIANLEGKLLITTSNRSEAAVGYCTMDGDTAGGFAPIAGVSKEFIIRWLNSVDLQRAFPSAALITAQKPTAELRPGSTQTDEDDLMPYIILNKIETWTVAERVGPKVVCERLVSEEGVTLENAFKYTKKFFQLFARNQWKRERYALAPQIDTRSLDPKSWCRFPVLSAGFDAELKELQNSLRF